MFEALFQTLFSTIADLFVAGIGDLLAQLLGGFAG